jgi:outer membrane receptor protein involved in Fe transport
VKKHSLIAVLMVLPFTSLFAQSLTTDTIEIREVVVTGTKVEVARRNIPLTVSLVPRETLEQTTESALLLPASAWPGVRRDS